MQQEILPKSSPERGRDRGTVVCAKSMHPYQANSPSPSTRRRTAGAVLLWAAMGCASGAAVSAQAAEPAAVQTTAALGSATAQAATRLLHVSSAGLNFGEVTLASQPVQVVTLTAVGTGDVTVSSAAVSGAGFRIVGSSLPITLQPAQSTTIRVQYQAQTLGAVNGQLTIESNSTQAPETTVSLTGSGTTAQEPQLTASAATLSFDGVTVGAPMAQTLTLTSEGTVPVTVNSAAVTGTGFKLVGGTFPVTLSPNQAVTLSVQFAPTVVGQQHGQLLITSNSNTGSTVRVPLLGASSSETSAQLSLSAMSVAFESAPVGSPAQQALTLTSTGSEPVTIQSITASGSGFHVVDGQIPVTLNPKQSTLVEVEFSPVQTGAVTGQLTLVSNAMSAEVMTVGLSGTGTGTAIAQLSSSASTLNFGTVEVDASATLQLTLTSTGTLPLQINSAAISGAGYKVLSGGLPMTLPAGESTTVDVGFEPTTAGTAAGTLTLVSNAANNASLRVALSGTASQAVHKVDLTWSAPASSTDPVAGYNVYRSTGGQTPQKIGSESKASTSYIDSSVKDGATYTYTVKSYDAEASESKASNVTTVTIP